MAYRSPFAGLVLALSVLAAPVAWAQTPAPAPAQAPAAAPATESQLAAARDLITSSGAQRTFDSVLPSVIGQVRQTFSRQHPDMIKDIEASLAVIEPEVEAKRADILDVAAKVYAARLSEQELKDSAAFFKSPTGQKYVQAQPAIFDDLFSEVRNWMGQLSEFTVSRLRTEMKKRGHDL
jgi:hypothetical protein